MLLKQWDNVVEKLKADSAAADVNKVLKNPVGEACPPDP